MIGERLAPGWRRRLILSSGRQAASGEPLLVFGLEGSAGREGALVSGDVALPLGSVVGCTANGQGRLRCGLWPRGFIGFGTEEPTSLEDGESGDAAANALDESHGVALSLRCCDRGGGVVGIRAACEE